MALLEDGGSFKKWGLVGGLQVTGGTWRRLEDSSSLLIFFCILAVNWAVLLHHTLPPWCTALPQAPNNKGHWSWIGISKTVSQNKPFFVQYKLIISDILLYWQKKLVNRFVSTLDLLVFLTPRLTSLKENKDPDSDVIQRQKKKIPRIKDDLSISLQQS